jgi:hypothetical protein
MYDQAVAEYTRTGQLGATIPKEALARVEVYKKSGWTAYVQANLDQLVEQSPQQKLPPFVVATFYARLGKKDQALTWLEESYEERDGRMIILSVAFEFDSFRSDPKLKELVRRMGLPE